MANHGYVLLPSDSRFFYLIILFVTSIPSPDYSHFDTKTFLLSLLCLPLFLIIFEQKLKNLTTRESNIPLRQILVVQGVVVVFFSLTLRCTCMYFDEIEKKKKWGMFGEGR